MSLHTSNTLAAAYLAVFGSLTLASLDAAGNERHERGMAVIEHLSGGAGQPVLEALREDYPFRRGHHRLCAGRCLGTQRAG